MTAPYRSELEAADDGNTVRTSPVGLSVAPYRSELEAALARVDALSSEAPPCSTCAACAERRRFVRGVAMLVLVAVASLAGVVAASLFLVGVAMTATGSFSPWCFGYAGLAAFFATSLYAVFARRLAT